MDLTEEEIDLLRASFRLISASPATAAALFYDRLFETAPELRPMFPADMEAQGTKMMSTLGLVVSRLHEMETMRPVLAALAARHVGYGVRREHYAKLAEPLGFMVARTLGDRCTPAIAAAWQKAFAGLSAAMIEAGYPR